MLSDEQIKKLEATANTIRQDIIAMLLEAKSGHSAGPLGMADVFTVLYHTDAINITLKTRSGKKETESFFPTATFARCFTRRWPEPDISQWKN